MIILDTNVLSALMRSTPDPGVVAWMDEQSAASLWVTSVTVFEARFGLALLPTGRRRKALEDAFEQVMVEDLSNRVLALDETAAAAAAAIAAARRRLGRTVDLRDTLIAGIAEAQRAAIATRNTSHFEGLSVPLINPWEGASARG